MRGGVRQSVVLAPCVYVWLVSIVCSTTGVRENKRRLRNIEFLLFSLDFCRSVHISTVLFSSVLNAFYY